MKISLTKFYYVKTFFQQFFHSSSSSSSLVGISLKSRMGVEVGNSRDFCGTQEELWCWFLYQSDFKCNLLYNQTYHKQLIKKCIHKICFFYIKIIIRKWASKTPRTLGKCWENLQSDVLKLEFYKNADFSGSFLKVTKLSKF